MGLEIAATSSREAWERLSTMWEASSIFHRWEWLEAASRASGTDLKRLIVSTDGVPEIAMPVFSRHFGPVVALMSPPPRLGIEYLGPSFAVGSAEDGGKRTKVLKALLDWVVTEFGPSFFYARTVPLMRDARPFLWSGHDVRPLYTYTLALTENVEHVFAKFDRKLRSDLNRTSGKVDVRSGGSDLCSRVHEFVSARYRLRGMTFGSDKQYLLELYEGLGSAAFQPIGAYADSGLEAAAIVTFHRKRASYWQGATRIGGPRLPLTDHLVWYAIRLANERGCDEFELVGANTPRLDSYKSKFRPTLEQFFEISKGTRAGKIAAALYARLRR